MYVHIMNSFYNNHLLLIIFIIYLCSLNLSRCIWYSAGFPVGLIAIILSLLSTITLVLFGAMIMSRPSDDKVLVTLLGSHCSGIKYFWMKCREIKPLSRSFFIYFPVMKTEI